MTTKFKKELTAEFLTDESIKKELLRVKAECSGFTWEAFKAVKYSGGFQYSLTPNSDENMTDNIETAMQMIKALSGNCGAWYEDGYFYIESSYHEDSLQAAWKAAGHAMQKSIYAWAADKYLNIPSYFYPKTHLN